MALLYWLNFQIKRLKYNCLHSTCHYMMILFNFDMDSFWLFSNLRSMNDITVKILIRICCVQKKSRHTSVQQLIVSLKSTLNYWSHTTCSIACFCKHKSNSVKADVTSVRDNNSQQVFILLNQFFFIKLSASIAIICSYLQLFATVYMT